MAVQLPPGSFYGETFRSCKLPSVELSERIYPARFHTPKHSHKQALFCYVMEGEYTEEYSGKTRECRSSTLLFHPPDELHAEYFHDSGGRSFLIEIEPDWLQRIRDQVKLADNSANFYGGTIELLAKKLYKEFVRMDDVSSIVIEGLLLEMLGEASRHSRHRVTNQPPRWLQQAREMLQERFAENLTLSEVARAAGVHPVHLAQMFNKTYHCTVGDYMRRLRIEYACHELATSEKPIVDIALAAGFCDQSHFTRTFKRSTGVAPSQYRETLRDV
jgi:AraC family transcriptional regulator